jgi:AraC family transcriptional regulator
VLVNASAGAVGRTNVLLWGRSGGRYHVRDFAGSLSIKTVVRGEGLWETATGRFRVFPGTHLVLNDGQRYSITVDSPRPVETFCVFFRRGFVEEAERTLVTPDARLLDDPFTEPAAASTFVEAVRLDDAAVAPQVAEVHREVAGGRATGLWLEERLMLLADALLAAERDVRARAARLPARRAGTRAEILGRLLRARDFLEASIDEAVTLRAVAREACLSPFHFHRLFRAAFGETPRDYLARRRLERARDLLARTDLPVTEVCLATGHESLGSFTASFRRRYGLPPARFRRALPENSKLGEEPAPPARRQ